MLKSAYWCLYASLCMCACGQGRGEGGVRQRSLNPVHRSTPIPTHPQHLYRIVAAAKTAAQQLDILSSTNGSRARAALLTALARGTDAATVAARVAGFGEEAKGDVAVANAYLLALAREGSVDQLVKALGEMKEGANGESYEIAMDALVQAGKYAEASALFASASLAAVPPTTKGVGLAMTALLRQGKAQDALALLPGAVAAGVDPSEGVVRNAVKAMMALGGGEKGLAAVRGVLVL